MGKGRQPRMLIPYRTGQYGRNSSYRSMNRYRNTLKMYRSRYWPISDNTDRTGVYRTFRPEKRNSAGTKTERKNRRNAWFEQTLVQQVATTLTSPIRSFFFSSFFSFFCCPSLLLWFLHFFCWTMSIAMWFLSLLLHVTSLENVEN